MWIIGNNEYKNSDKLVFFAYMISFYSEFYFIQLITPEWIFAPFSWINFRIIYSLFFVTDLIMIIVNMFKKSKQNYDLWIFINIAFFEAFVFIYLKYPIFFVARFQTNYSILYAFVLFFASWIITKIQYTKGTLFFLPNRCRTKVFEYRRRIAEDFEFIRMDQSEWPQWDLWLQKLNQPSLLAENRSLSQIEGNQCYGGYMKTKEGTKLHYFWLLKMIEDNKKENNAYLEIDQFDD